MGSQNYGIDAVRLNEYAQQIKEVSEMGVEIGIVIGLKTLNCLLISAKERNLR